MFPAESLPGPLVGVSPWGPGAPEATDGSDLSSVVVSPLEGWARQSRDGSTVQEDSALDLGLKGHLPPWRATPAGDVPVGSTAGDGVWLGTGPLSALGAERPGGPQAPCLMTFPGIQDWGQQLGVC